MDSGHSYNWTQISDSNWVGRNRILAVFTGIPIKSKWQKADGSLQRPWLFFASETPSAPGDTDITVCIFPHFYFFISTMCPMCVMVFPCNMNAFGCCRCFSEARKHILNFPPTDFNGIQGIRFLTILTELFLNRIETYLSKTNYNKKWYQISQLLHPNLRKIKVTAEIWIIPKCIEMDYYTYTDTGILRSNFIWSCVYVGYLHLQ